VNCGRGFDVAQVISLVVACAEFIATTATMYYAAPRRASLGRDLGAT
jgi:hypothetical protein